MKNYYSVEEISTEIGVHKTTLYKKAKELEIDTQKITKSKKNKLIEACKPIVQQKKTVNSYVDLINGMKVQKSEAILNQSGSTLEKRLEIAKREFDFVNNALVEIENIILSTGFVLNNNNLTVSISPAMKTKIELLKQHNALQKTIQELEDKMRYTIINTVDDSAIED